LSACRILSLQLKPKLGRTKPSTGPLRAVGWTWLILGLGKFQFVTHSVDSLHERTLWDKIRLHNSNKAGTTKTEPRRETHEFPSKSTHSTPHGVNVQRRYGWRVSFHCFSSDSWKLTNGSQDTPRSVKSPQIVGCDFLLLSYSPSKRLGGRLKGADLAVR